ncbi:MAG TPA: integrase arm-type DNA-binding domain-containing protein [Rickettsiales bacterium]|nr:integrase arm-type DNA-binding domain-containing protein [Rickettsiales bacterium]
MKLTATAINNTKAKDKALKLFDGGGLFLLVKPAGGKWWRLKYRFGGKEKLLSLGTYPEVSLKEARERREEARKLLANGVDPSDNRKAVKATQVELAANTFEVIAREWWAKFSEGWTPGHADKVIRRLERCIFPWLGNKPIREITPSVLLTCIRRIEDRKALETAHRALQNCGQICYQAMDLQRRARRVPDPTLKMR